MTGDTVDGIGAAGPAPGATAGGVVPVGAWASQGAGATPVSIAAAISVNGQADRSIMRIPLP